jgi:hypothetical protein
LVVVVVVVVVLRWGCCLLGDLEEEEENWALPQKGDTAAPTSLAAGRPPKTTTAVKRKDFSSGPHVPTGHPRMLWSINPPPPPTIVVGQSMSTLVYVYL